MRPVDTFCVMELSKTRVHYSEKDPQPRVFSMYCAGNTVNLKGRSSFLINKML